MKYDPNTKTVTITLMTAQHCGFDMELYEWELEANGLYTPETSNPERIVIVVDDRIYDMQYDSEKEGVRA